MGQRVSARNKTRTCDTSFTAPPQEIVFSNSPGLQDAVPMSAAHRKIHKLTASNMTPSKSEFIFYKDTLSVEVNNDRFLITFMYDADTPHNVTLQFGLYHKGLNNGIPLFSEPKSSTKTSELKLGTHLVYRADEEMYLLPGCTVYGCSFTTERGFVPILIRVDSLGNDTSHYLMAGLLYDDRSYLWHIILTKYRIRQGDSGYQIQEIYGLSDSKVSDSDKRGESKNCAICLTTPVDTILIPCRHMCLCYSCACDLNARRSSCPYCRKYIVQIIHVS